MSGFFKTLRRKLKIKISLLKQRRRRNSLYPRIIPQNLWEIDLGEELTRAPSLTSLNSADQQPTEELPDTAEDYSDSATDSTAEEALPCQQIQWATDSSKHVQLVELCLSPDSMINGKVMVSNLAYHKNIFVRWTADKWVTFEDQLASYEQSADDFSRDYFVFSIKSPSLERENSTSGVYVELAVAYQVGGMDFWDNNSQQNFGLLMK